MILQDHTQHWYQILDRITARLSRRIRQIGTGREPPDTCQATLDAIEDWICTIDLDARIIRSNKTSERLFNTPARLTAGTPCCRFLHGKEAPLPGCPLQRMNISGKRESAEMEIKDGRYMLITVDPVRDSTGNLIGAVHIARDITSRILIQNERERLVKDLKAALTKIKTLSGMLPICSSCKKIRDDKGYWNLIESYIESHSHAQFSHGLCPGCMEEIYGKEDWYREMKDRKG